MTAYGTEDCVVGADTDVRFFSWYEKSESFLRLIYGGLRKLAEKL